MDAYTYITVDISYLLIHHSGPTRLTHLCRVFNHQDSLYGCSTFDIDFVSFNICVFGADCYSHLATCTALQRTCSERIALVLVTTPDVADAVRPDLTATARLVDKRVVVGNLVAQTRIRRRIHI